MADILTDSYKYTHPLLYPPDTSEVYSYMEARVPSTEKVMHFGLQYYLKNYLSTPSDGKFFVDKNFKVVTNSNEIEENILKPVFLDGKLLKDWTFDEVRENARQ